LTWVTVPATSAVSVLVIDWTTIGWAEPTRTPETSTVVVGLRWMVTGGKLTSSLSLLPREEKGY